MASSIMNTQATAEHFKDIPMGSYIMYRHYYNGSDFWGTGILHLAGTCSRGILYRGPIILQEDDSRTPAGPAYILDQMREMPWVHIHEPIQIISMDKYNFFVSNATRR